MDSFCQLLHTHMIFRFLLLLIVLLAHSAHAREVFTATVTYVTDGDTLWVQPGTGGPPRKLRLQGIDAPEICQRGGKVARDWLRRLAAQRQVTVTVTVTYSDRYGRGQVTIALDGTDLAAQMVRAGHAWSDGWRGRPGRYAAEEALARQSRLGLFAAAHPESPREFRKRHGSCHVTGR